MSWEELMIKVLLVVAVLLVIIVALVTWVRRSRAGQRLVGVAAPEPGAAPPKLFTGDVMRSHVVTSGSLARLEAFDWGIRVRGIGLSRWLITTWEARYSELAIAELVSTRQSRIAIWFRLQGETGGTAFLTHRHEEILKLLEKRGIPVNRSVQTIRGAADLESAAR
jgi:hypothetical protein